MNTLLSAAHLRWLRRFDVFSAVHGGMVDASDGSSLSFRDPGDIALELFAAATT